MIDTGQTVQEAISFIATVNREDINKFCLDDTERY
jgi:hypothetical protein